MIIIVVVVVVVVVVQGRGERLHAAQESALQRCRQADEGPAERGLLDVYYMCVYVYVYIYIYIYNSYVYTHIYIYI